ncbi:unnamed protein product [Didymodactylos carnosus]|uniref:Uncharacterized protein n=1 Tax=Didymodactylos carnosus TaxID=1234261 RepID=A0A815T7U7_9BILA|nr:unnamed protein product [Didymodactylos carnosus]CAF1497536.1 unnamed protein product [Didymodactylos carnosus]CAF4023552.1 unnamed protein product [Didymodactylos carnosus]CAF4359736.1 unnamed protein product [Didymodactylos carnosus]
MKHFLLILSILKIVSTTSLMHIHNASILQNNIPITTFINQTNMTCLFQGFKLSTCISVEYNRLNKNCLIYSNIQFVDPQQWHLNLTADLYYFRSRLITDYVYVVVSLSSQVILLPLSNATNITSLQANQTTIFYLFLNIFTNQSSNLNVTAIYSNSSSFTPPRNDLTNISIIKTEYMSKWQRNLTMYKWLWMGVGLNTSHNDLNSLILADVTNQDLYWQNWFTNEYLALFMIGTRTMSSKNVTLLDYKSLSYNRLFYIGMQNSSLTTCTGYLLLINSLSDPCLSAGTQQLSLPIILVSQTTSSQETSLKNNSVEAKSIILFATLAVN